ncbi:hypothetical protein Tco_0773678 [Tanacetum coccineum]|uniref:Uncharacterized protein n=1 Tax=Tanacetum coccineum TaxID=301880 RepID=A0ABQ4ZPE2_9ASTR
MKLGRSADRDPDPIGALRINGELRYSRVPVADPDLLPDTHCWRGVTTRWLESSHEFGSASGSGRCGDDESGDDEDGGEDEEDEDADS